MFFLLAFFTGAHSWASHTKKLKACQGNLAACLAGNPTTALSEEVEKYKNLYNKKKTEVQDAQSEVAKLLKDNGVLSTQLQSYKQVIDTLTKAIAQVKTQAP